MTCDPLPATGLGANAVPLLLLGIACLFAGITTMLLARRRGRRASAVVVLLLLLGTGTTVTTVGMEAPAQAATSGCSLASPSTDSSTASSPGSASPESAPTGRLVVAQTSTMSGLAPGVAPVPITGRVENHSQESTSITTVSVEIASITPRPGSSAPTCGVSDYRLVDPRMPVGQTLAPGDSTPFAGASIGFNNKTTNQDACQGATIHLLYTANPR